MSRYHPDTTPARLPGRRIAGITPARLAELADQLERIEEPGARLVAGAELLTAVLDAAEQLEVTCWAVRGALGLRAKPEVKP